MDYLFSQHDLSFLDDVIPEKDKKKKEDEKKKKKKKGSMDSDNDDVRSFLLLSNDSFLASLSRGTVRAPRQLWGWGSPSLF